MNATAIRTFLVRASTLLLTLAGAATAVGQPAVRAILQPASERKAAPQLALKDSSGQTISLTDYRGKVVLLDFWG
jgi:cytochrome oxidase Cu insertion factor (SCO1/SenC/PrrC family)